MRIIYAGTPDFAVPALQALLNSEHEVIAVYTQPDRPAGRGKKLRASPVKQVAQAAGVSVYQPEALKSPEVQQELSELQPDLMVVAAYGLLLPRAVLDAPQYGCINIHASLLPRWRGAAPIHRAILAGDEVTGVTIMQMAEGLDTGDMLYKLETAISATDNTASLHDRLADMGAKGILVVLDQISQGMLSPESQDESLATYAKKLSKQESVIDWQQEAAAIVRKIHAFNPWPVAQTGYDGTVIRIWDAVAIDQSAGADIGQVIAEDKTQGIQVQAGMGTVCLTRLQLPGGKPLTAAEFLNGRSLLGIRLQ